MAFPQVREQSSISGAYPKRTATKGFVPACNFQAGFELPPLARAPTMKRSSSVPPAPQPVDAGLAQIMSPEPQRATYHFDFIKSKEGTGSPRCLSNVSTQAELPTMPSTITRAPTLVGDDEWGPLLLEAFFRPPGHSCDDDSDEEWNEDDVEDEEYLSMCKDMLLTLVPKRDVANKLCPMSAPATMSNLPVLPSSRTATNS
mmetsp:Transcript_4919/g.9994  ORF Transcript_4919/g.9994 Transcript_4919/m.9994 type:complete len:201 (+) Transcript_4919:211-813(+)